MKNEGPRPVDDGKERLVELLDQHLPRVERTVTAAFGPARAEEIMADLRLDAWRYRDRVVVADNPAGYLFTMARHIAQRRGPSVVLLPEVDPSHTPTIEPELPRLLQRLSLHQRTALVLIAGYGFTYREVAEMLEISVSSVDTHYQRGLAAMRAGLGVEAL